MTWPSDDIESVDEHMVLIAPCALCGIPFTCNPVTVPSLWIDPATGLPPDVQPHPDGHGPDRARRGPLCPDCVDRFNQAKTPPPFPGLGRTT